jgi:ABC-type nitrate/sulfonate/bicarbonate transport system permease component
MNATACRIAFCILYPFYKGAPALFTASYLEHLTARGLIPPSDYPDSGAAHMEDMLSGCVAIVVLAVVLALFFAFTAGCRRFQLRLLPSRRIVIGFAFRALIVFWIYSIIASETVTYFHGGYWPLIASTYAGVAAVLILYIGVDSTHFQHRWSL